MLAGAPLAFSCIGARHDPATRRSRSRFDAPPYAALAPRPAARDREPVVVGSVGAVFGSDACEAADAFGKQRATAGDRGGEYVRLGASAELQVGEGGRVDPGCAECFGQCGRVHLVQQELDPTQTELAEQLKVTQRGSRTSNTNRTRGSEPSLTTWRRSAAGWSCARCSRSAPSHWRCPARADARPSEGIPTCRQRRLL